MRYEPHTIYHIYNQGNNKQPIFFERENYLYFLQKMQKHLLPNVELLCYCLMPNHFHWLVYTKVEGCFPSKAAKPRSIEDRHLAQYSDSKEVDLVANKAIKSNFDNQQSLSQAIGTLLSGYTKAINKRYNRSGSLFRSKTKAKTNCIEDIITVDSKYWNGTDYAAYCFGYIHDNPKNARLVVNSEDWEFSSVRDYLGLRNGTICNLNLAKELELW